MIEVAAHAGLATARVIQVGHADLMKSLAVEVRPRRNLPEGPFSDTLTIRPADGKRPLLVPVQGRVVPRLLVSPTTILFSDVARQTGPMQRHVLLRRTDGKHLSIQKWTAPAGIQLEEVPAPKGAEARVRKLLQVTLSPAGVSRDFRDERLLLWLEDEPEPLCVQVIVFMDQKKTGSAH